MNWQNGWLRALIVLLALAVALHLLGVAWELAARFGDVITLFGLAWLIAFVLRPPARWLARRRRVPWGLAVAVVYLLFFAGVLIFSFILLPILATQLTQITAMIPAWIEQLPGWFATMGSYLPEQLRSVDISSIYSERELIAQLQQPLTGLLQNALAVLTGIATALFALVIILVLSFYITLDGDRIGRQMELLVPASYKQEVRVFGESVERSFGGFLRGQLIQATVYAVGTAIVMGVANLPFVALTVTIAAIAMIIPFIGPIIAIAPPLIIAAATGSLSLLIGVGVALLVLQQFVFNVLAPKVMSETVGIHPLLVLLAILVGSKVAGIAGAIFGVPVAAVLSAMAGVLYQRTLATDEVLPAETEETEALKDRP